MVITGITADGKTRNIRVDEDGKLDVGLVFDGTVNVGEVSFSQTPGENTVVVGESALPDGAASETTLGSILTKLADPATSAKQDTGNTSLSAINGKITACNTGAVVISSSALPSGAATAAKQPALGTAGTPSADVISVQGVTNGTPQPVSGTVTANVATTSLAKSSAYEASRVIKASAGTLFSLTGYNSGPAQFLQIFNSASVPANSTAPDLLVAVPAQSTFAFEWRSGLVFSTGISISNSSTGPTKTIGSNDCYFTASYI